LLVKTNKNKKEIFSRYLLVLRRKAKISKINQEQVEKREGKIKFSSFNCNRNQSVVMAWNSFVLLLSIF
jgi:hypothetical protein